MKPDGLARDSRGGRKWVRYERRYSNAMWHADWYVMTEPRFAGANLIAYMDDASRCITGFGLFAEATPANMVSVLGQAVEIFGTPAGVLYGSGSQSASARRRTPDSRWKPALSEEQLLGYGTTLMSSGPGRRQTNNKLRRFFRTLEDELPHFEGVLDFITYYNEERLHFSLDINNHQYPLQAFHQKRATDAIREANPRWMEEGMDDGRT